jgi:predicted transcriptional regulator
MKKGKKVHHLIAERNERINQFLQLLKENPNIPVKKLMAEFSFNTGISLRKVEEYLKILVATGKVKIVEKKFRNLGEEVEAWSSLSPMEGFAEVKD